MIMIIIIIILYFKSTGKKNFTENIEIEKP